MYSSPFFSMRLARAPDSSRRRPVAVTTILVSAELGRRERAARRPGRCVDLALRVEGFAAAADHAEEILFGSVLPDGPDHVQLVLDVGPDVFLDASPLDLTEVGMNDDDLRVRDVASDDVILCLGVFAAGMRDVEDGPSGDEIFDGVVHALRYPRLRTFYSKLQQVKSMVRRGSQNRSNPR